jgi:cytidine deaminase
MTDKELLLKAIEARELAYAPYSNHKVGAALVGKSGKIYLGCNVENAAYTPTNCAERTAIFKAVSEGEREFSAIAIVGGMDGNTEKPCAPCGVCRQVLREFCDPDSFLILLGYDDGNDYRYDEYTLGELLPESFGPDHIRK